MTEEEMAEEYIKANNLEWELECNRTSPIGEVKQAFLAGLKAQTKWHKVADGDLPNTEREVLVFMWDSYYLGYYSQKDSRWHFEDFDEESEQVIAWCEIPQFKDKE